MTLAAWGALWAISPGLSRVSRGAIEATTLEVSAYRFPGPVGNVDFASPFPDSAILNLRRGPFAVIHHHTTFPPPHPPAAPDQLSRTKRT